MTPSRSLLCAAALLAAGLSLGALLPQDAPPPAPASPTSPEIARLVAMEGLWQTETVFTGSPATTGLAQIHMMGSRWLIEDFKGEFMGQEFFGHGVTGWDPAQSCYVGVWADTADTKLMLSKSQWDEEQKALVSEPHQMDVGQGPVMVRGVLRVPNADSMVFTMSPVAEDAPPVMTITYTRSR